MILKLLSLNDSLTSPRRPRSSHQSVGDVSSPSVQLAQPPAVAQGAIRQFVQPGVQQPDPETPIRISTIEGRTPQTEEQVRAVQQWGQSLMSSQEQPYFEFIEFPPQSGKGTIHILMNENGSPTIKLRIEDVSILSAGGTESRRIFIGHIKVHHGNGEFTRIPILAKESLSKEVSQTEWQNYARVFKGQRPIDEDYISSLSGHVAKPILRAGSLLIFQQYQSDLFELIEPSHPPVYRRSSTSIFPTLAQRAFHHLNSPTPENKGILDNSKAQFTHVLSDIFLQLAQGCLTTANIPTGSQSASSSSSSSSSATATVQLGLVNKDIKPENILIKSIVHQHRPNGVSQPWAELVFMLADLGQNMVQNGSIECTGSGAGFTPYYAPIELLILRLDSTDDSITDEFPSIRLTTDQDDFLKEHIYQPALRGNGFQINEAQMVQSLGMTMFCLIFGQNLPHTMLPFNFGPEQALWDIPSYKNLSKKEFSRLSHDQTDSYLTSRIKLMNHLIPDLMEILKQSLRPLPQERITLLELIDQLNALLPPAGPERRQVRYQMSSYFGISEQYPMRVVTTTRPKPQREGSLFAGESAEGEPHSSTQASGVAFRQSNRPKYSASTAAAAAAAAAATAAQDQSQAAGSESQRPSFLREFEAEAADAPGSEGTPSKRILPPPPQPGSAKKSKHLHFR